jgi:peptidoglycan/LPS O-acetylase OafA/YrhL
MSVLRLELPPPARGRLEAVDELKGIAIILVVLYHAGGVLVWANDFHFDLGVDLFIILSGIGLGFGAHYAGAGAFLARRLVRILPAYWLVLTACWFGGVTFLNGRYSAANLWIHYLGLQGWLGDDYAFALNDSFWYVTLILTLYVLYCACRTLLDSPEQLLLAGAAISAFIAFIFTYSAGYTALMGHLALRVPGFFAGLLLGRLLKVGRIEFKLGPPLAFALLLLCYVPYTQGVLAYTPVVGLSLIGIYLFAAKRLALLSPGTPLARALRFLGDHSLEIFLIHQPLIREYNYYAYRRWFNNGAPGTWPLLAGILAGLAATLVLSLALHWLLQKIPLPFPPSRAPA